VEADVLDRHPGRGVRRGLTLALAGLALAGCSSSAPPGRSAGAVTTQAPVTSGATVTAGPAPSVVLPSGPCDGTPAPARYAHVVWIWMENHTDVLRSPEAGYERQLATACASASNDADVGSPSLPNYIGATSGSTWGIGDDANPASHRVTADNLFRQVRAAGAGERSYEEAMPAPCTLHGVGRYAVKHNPAAYYVGAGDRAACQADDVGFGAFASDIDAGTLPAFAFVTPDLCDDTHDCSIATGDRWLAQWVPRLLSGPNYRDGRTAVFVVWDEPTPMAELVIAPSVHPGTAVSVRTDHYALLRTTEELIGLPLLGRAATAVDLRPLYGL
jgi:phosphatidylinositol-3-phosphatase